MADYHKHKAVRCQSKKISKFMSLHVGGMPKGKFVGRLCVVSLDSLRLCAVMQEQYVHGTDMSAVRSGLSQALDYVPCIHEVMMLAGKPDGQYLPPGVPSIAPPGARADADAPHPALCRTQSAQQSCCS